jgi:integrase
METEQELVDFLALTESGEIEGFDTDRVVSENEDGSIRSRIGDSEWDFNQYNNDKSPRSKFILKWKEKDHNPLLLNDLRRRADHLFNYDHYDEEDESLIYNRKGVTKSVIVGDVEKALNILTCFKDTNINNLGALSHPVVWAMIEEELINRKLGSTSIEGYLTALTRLMDANKFIPEYEHFIVHISRNSLAKELAAEGKGKGSTPTIIPEVYSTVLAKMISTVESAYDKIDEWSLTTKEYALKYNITAQEVYAQKKLITAVCFNSCIAFTGCRISELVTFHNNSYHEIEVLGIKAPLLSGSTIKLESGIERDDVWCCAPICEKAIEVILSIWKKERKDPDNISELPTYNFKRKEGEAGNISSKAKPVNLDTSNMTSLLELASEAYNITYNPTWDESYKSLNHRVQPDRDPRKELDDGTIIWHFSTHTWRRSFAHFGVGNGIVSLASVKQQFKHLCISMTGIYSASSDIITLLGINDDPLLKKELDNARKEYNDEYLRKTFSDENLASGGFAKTVLGENAEPTVMSEEKYQSLHEKTFRAARSTGYGRCFGEEKCDLNHVFEPSGCIESECSNLSINHEEALRWKERHSRMSTSMMNMLKNNMINPNIFGREISDIRAAEKIMTDHGIEFTKFEGALPVCEV